MPNSIDFNENFPIIDKSQELYKRAKDLIPSATQTLAKGPEQHTKGIAPIYLQSGKGCHVTDVDGNEYLDFTMGVGPISLGYCYKRVDDAILEQLQSGITFSLMHPLEVEVAELISQVIPNAECVRFSKTGADVTSAAVRLARAYTGKNTVLCCGYHGWHDWYISVTDRNIGIPKELNELTYTFNYNDIKSVIDSIDSHTAAIILEPVVFDEPQNNFLHLLREICTEKGIVLIFDEMWTGFRMALGGAQEYFGIKADLAVFSKAVANGMPLSVLSGKREIMELLEKDVFFYTTFGGEALSLAAARETILELKEKDVSGYLNDAGDYLKHNINLLIENNDMPYLKIIGYGFRTLLTFDSNSGNPLEMKTLVQQELIKNGILWAGSHNMSYSHSAMDIDYTISVYKSILPKLKEAVDSKNIRNYLKGEVLKPVFRRIGNFNTKPKI